MPYKGGLRCFAVTAAAVVAVATAFAAAVAAAATAAAANTPLMDAAAKATERSPTWYLVLSFVPGT